MVVFLRHRERWSALHYLDSSGHQHPLDYFLGTLHRQVRSPPIFFACLSYFMEPNNATRQRRASAPTYLLRLILFVTSFSQTSERFLQ